MIKSKWDNLTQRQKALTAIVGGVIIIYILSRSEL